MKIIFATRNSGKVKEMREILNDLSLEIVSSEESGAVGEAIEDGKTFEENALKKARYIGTQMNCWTIADDSGICIEALGGAPGVFSARWAGTNAETKEFERLTIRAADGSDTRRAWFETAVALVAPDGRHWTFSGKAYGHVPKSPRGTARPGLPYDAVFIPEGHEKTFAEMTHEEKNKISHRGLAFEQLKKFLKELFHSHHGNENR